jgi:hypothetical protein
LTQAWLIVELRNFGYFYCFLSFCRLRSIVDLQHSFVKDSEKVAACVNLVRKLTGTNWGANAVTLRTASLALVYLTAEYCAPVWLNSVHTSKIDIQLNKTTQLQWLPVLANIAPLKLRREATTVCELVNCRRHARSLLYKQMLDIPDQRLLFRRYVWSFDPNPSTTLFYTFPMPGLRHGQHRYLPTVI